MRWLVDGNNVMGSRPDGWWRDRAGAQLRLLGRIEAWAEAEGADVAVVFDGRAPEGAGAFAVAAAWAGHADDAIAARAEPGVRVVTSDAGLIARVRGRGAEVEKAGAFLRRIAWA